MIGTGTPFQVAILSPETTLYKGEATFAAVPAWYGELGVLHGHAPLLALLGAGTLRLETSGGTRRFRVEGGFVQVVDDRLTVLSEQAQPE